MRTEQQAAIEDLIKAEQISTVEKPVTFQDEDVSVRGGGGGGGVRVFSPSVGHGNHRRLSDNFLLTSKQYHIIYPNLD